MTEVSMIGLDLAKNAIQAHGSDETGKVVFRRRLRRGTILPFLSQQPRCTIAMEACGSAHYWGREIAALGHEVRLVAPVYVKPFVKRQKNDAADAEAVCEAASRPTMRFVTVKSAEKQASAVAFKVRDLFVRQRTQAVNALRGHLAEFGLVAPQGIAHLERLVEMFGDDSTLPKTAREGCMILVETIQQLTARIRELDGEITRRSKRDDGARRLMTIPGVGPVIATALEALAPPPESFQTGRDFAAWMGLTPRQHSTGGKPRLVKTSKMGQRDLRRLLIIGATTVVRWAARHSAPEGSWLARMLARKPRMLIAVALANKMARIA